MANIDALASYTIGDIAKATSVDGKVLPIYDALVRRIPMLADASWQAANRPEFHRVHRRTSGIIGTKVGINEGIVGSKINLDTIDEHMERIEDNSIVDTRMLDYYPEIIAYRNKMDTLKVKDLTVTFATDLFYANRGTDPRSFDGLAKRLPNTSTVNVKKADTAGTAPSSIYLVAWGEDTSYLIHPQGSSVFGVEVEDKGQVRVLDSNSKPYYAFESWLTMRGGLSVPESRSIGRIANIDTALAGVFTSKNVMGLINAVVPNMITNGKICAYVSPACYSALLDYIQAKGNIWYSVDEFGSPVTTFAGIQWRVCDAITNAEAIIS